MILKRLRDIISARINAWLDKAEKPEQMLDQYIRNAETALGEVKARTADAMVIEKRCNKMVSECAAMVAEMNDYAKAALAAGNEKDAELFVAKRLELEKQLTEYQKSASDAAQSVAAMRETHDKLAKELFEYRNRRDIIRSKLSVIEASKQAAKTTSMIGRSSGAVSEFARMEEKVDTMMMQADALRELDSQKDELTLLKEKYDCVAVREDVSQALDALKNKTAS